VSPNFLIRETAGILHRIGAGLFSSPLRLARRAAPAVVVGVLALFLQGTAPITRDGLVLKFDMTPEKLLRNFDIIVFRNEFDDRVDSYLRKWVVPLRVFLDVRSGDPKVVRFLVERHLRHLAKITGHDITLVDDPAAANVTVVFERDSRLGKVGNDYFGKKFDIRQVSRSNVCFGRYYSNNSYEIFRAIVVIPIDRAMSRGRLPACVVEELTQILGLPNDSDEVFPSIFNDKSIDEDLTPHDIILIRSLYDPRLKPGMPRGEVLRQVKRILTETQP